MATIDLGKIQPLDIILSTGNGLMAGGIRAAQRLNNKRDAPFSHVAIALSPTLIVESGDNDIDFVNLLTGNGKYLSNNELIYGNNDNYSSIYLDIPKYKHCAVYRNVNLLPFGRFDGSNAYKFDIESALYRTIWKQYPLWSQLTGALAITPRILQKVIEKLESNKINSGMFCSEFVSDFFQILKLIEQPTSIPTPSDFAYFADWSLVKEAVVRKPKGMAFGGVKDEIVNILSPSLPEGNVRIHMVGKIAREIFEKENGNPEMLAIFLTQAENLIRIDLSFVRLWLQVSASFWSWFHFSEFCKKTCPADKDVAEWSSTELRPIKNVCSSRMDCSNRTVSLKGVRAHYDLYRNTMTTALAMRGA